MIDYRIGNDLDMSAVIAVYKKSRLSERRPADDATRMERMVREANLVITAWDGDVLVGIARCLTDFSYVTYLADLAVSADYQRRGIGRALIEEVRRAGGPQAKVVLFAAPEAVDYYARIGFTQNQQGWILGATDPLI